MSSDTFQASKKKSDEIKADLAVHPEKYTMLTGDRPTGRLHMGHYFGTIKERVKLQEMGITTRIIVADYQVITDRDTTANIADNVHNMVIDYMACGIDPEKTIIFTHSSIPALNQLMLPFLSLCTEAELMRNPTVKSEQEASGHALTGLLLTYPVHQACDILFCKGNVVPVGKDQMQHLEICRDIAQRVNGVYGNVFTVPEGYYSKTGASVKSLSDPLKKMSKSDVEDSFISVLDTPDIIRRKYRRAVTDSEACVRFDPEKQPGVSNLLSIIAALTGEDIEKVTASFEGKGYGDLKAAVTDVTVETLAPIQAEYARIMKDKKYMEQVYRDGAQHASYLAERTLQKFMKKIGYVAK